MRRTLTLSAALAAVLLVVLPATQAHAYVGTCTTSGVHTTFRYIDRGGYHPGPLFDPIGTVNAGTHNVNATAYNEGHRLMHLSGYRPGSNRQVEHSGWMRADFCRPNF